ncbi:acetyl-CoA carboxylase biotin carboxylase subunit family protein [Streptomyces sp. NPDC048419]|uniref:ATP-grasp domain-containing protein n=1 Tax=Streptomyces sp. NPDC048419 TaxID=3365547 RepID=UPI003722A01D
MTTHRHVVHVALDDHSLDVDALDFDNYTLTLLVDRHTAGRLPKSVLGRFARVGVLDLPDGAGVEGYDRVVDEMIDLVKGFSKELGDPSAIVGLYEYTTLPAARLREHFGIPGTDVGTALRFRDKILMKESLRDVVRLPRFWPVGAATTEAELAAIAAELPGKVVLKPARQAASIGVKVFHRSADLLEYARTTGIQDNHEVEEFIEGTICHIDGVVRDGRILFLSAAKYFLGNNLTFEDEGESYGSVTVDDAELVERIAAFTDRVLVTLGLRDSSFHLELFLTPTGELVFLEIGSRFGGGYNSRHLRTVYGIDLVGESIAACMNLPSAFTTPTTHLKLATDHQGASGWFYSALSERARCRVRRIHGLDKIPSSVVYAEIPEIGQPLNDGPGLRTPSGSFVLAGASSAHIERDMRQISYSYSVEVDVDAR